MKRIPLAFTLRPRRQFRQLGRDIANGRIPHALATTLERAANGYSAPLLIGSAIGVAWSPDSSNAYAAMWNTNSVVVLGPSAAATSTVARVSRAGPYFHCQCMGRKAA